MKDYIQHFDKTRIPFFVCIGTSKSKIDMVAPCIGTLLEKAGFEVLGTEEKNLHALNMVKRLELVDKLDKTKYQIIAIDSAISRHRIHIGAFPCRPGRSMKKKLPEVGEISIHVSLLHDKEPQEQLRMLIENECDEEHTRALAEEVAKNIIEVYAI